MDFASSLEARQTRALAMTPQLRQAIGLLQFGNIELSNYLRREAQKNPLLEVRLAQSPEGDGPRGKDQGRPVSLPGQGAAASANDFGDTLAAAPDSLEQHVSGQIGLNIHDEGRRRIALEFLEALEPHGWLSSPVEEIAAACGCTKKAAEEVLGVLQTFEPTGIFARTLSECLRLQAQDQGLLDEIMAGLLDNLDLLGAGDLEALAARCGCRKAEIDKRLETLRGFDPKPGVRFGGAPQPIRPPDLIVTDEGGGWSVELNASTLPEILVREDRVADADKRDAFVAEALANARGLKRAIEQRNANTLAIAAEVVRRQEAFLDDAGAPLVPMSMREVANAVTLHESTVSRVTAGLTVQTPHGMMELRGFFSRGLRDLGGEGAVPLSVIRARIAALVRAEPAGRPLSDENIAASLRQEGVSIQRRTVAKYRKVLGIPRSAMRRRTGQGAAARR